jgi:diguanylate cyclase (GGDEF)-like protein
VGATLALSALGAGVWPVAIWSCALLLGFGAFALAAMKQSEQQNARGDGRGGLDELTGLPGPAELRSQLELRLAEPAAAHAGSLVLLTVEGLKRYNDSYGHACGDALIAWLAGKLVGAVGARGAAYRLRGGEFALLIDGEPHVLEEVVAAAESALSEVGDGFVIWCSHGEARLPEEARTAAEALKLVDRRAHSYRSRPYAGLEAAERVALVDDPLGTLRHERARFDVAELAASVGRQLGLGVEALEQLEVAAQLRDVGNMAIPAAVLGRPGRITAPEWRFVGLHTLVGERLLAANFGMEAVATLVRSSHERWDGQGYPDGLSGAEIPLGSRVVFVCSAFQDMTSERPHRKSLSANEALAELKAGAGSQFDPSVVEAFAEAFLAASVQSSERARPLAWRRMRVLVAEDEAASRFLLRQAIEAQGHECLASEDGDEAWELFNAHHPEVVVSDWLMPRMDGDELCRRIREDADAPYTYFIMLTALEDKAHVLRGMQAGVDDFLPKPLDRQDLEMRLIAASRVTALHRRVREQHEAMRAEVDLAATVQRGLLPDGAPTVTGLRLDGRCVPAARVGGDYFDFLLDEQGRLTVIVADVAGHSLSSALLMAMVRSILRREASGAGGPAELLAATNRALFNDLVRAELFITAVCARYDPRGRRLELASAGHNPPLLRRAASGSVSELDADGVALGILEDGGYEQHEFVLAEGDVLVLYTDGVVESADVEGTQFGERRLAELVGDVGVSAPHEWIETIFAAVGVFARGREQQDDLTVVALEVERS